MHDIEEKDREILIGTSLDVESVSMQISDRGPESMVRTTTGYSMRL